MEAKLNDGSIHKPWRGTQESENLFQLRLKNKISIRHLITNFMLPRAQSEIVMTADGPEKKREANANDSASVILNSISEAIEFQKDAFVINPPCTLTTIVFYFSYVDSRTQYAISQYYNSEWCYLRAWWGTDLQWRAWKLCLCARWKGQEKKRAMMMIEKWNFDSWVVRDDRLSCLRVF